METANKSVTGEWSRVVDLGADFLLSVIDPVEIAFTNADATAPTVAFGHYLAPGSGLTRSVAVDGAIWARAIGAPPAIVIVS